MEHETETTPELKLVKDSIGTFLKSHRVRQDLSIRKISQETKIGVTVLENIEKDNLDELPNKTYVVGFVKSYSRVLGLKEKETLECLENTYKKLKPTSTPSVLEASADTNTKSSPLLTVVAFSIVAVIVVVVAIFNLKKENTSVPAEMTESGEVIPQVLSPETPLKNEVQNATPIPVEEPKEIVEEKVEKPKPLAAPAPTPVVAKEAPIIQPVETKAPIIEKKKEEKKKEEKKEEIVFYEATGELFHFDMDMNQDTIDKLLPLNFRVPISQGQQVIFVNAYQDDTWLAYKSDDAPVKHFVLRKGKTLLIRGNTIRIVLGNINSTQLFYNNKPINAESKSGVRSLIFPKEQISNFKFPLFVFKKNGSIVTSEEYQQNPN